MSLKKSVSTTAAATALAVALAGATTGAAYAQPTPATQSNVASATAGAYGGITADQWRQIASNAQAAGDTAGAQAANRAAQNVSGGGSSTSPQAATVLWTVAKKAIKTALVHGRQYLPKQIRPYADKIVDVIDAIDDFSEGALMLGLQSAGVPYDVARGVSQWVTTFLL